MTQRRGDQCPTRVATSSRGMRLALRARIIAVAAQRARRYDSVAAMVTNNGRTMRRKSEREVKRRFLLTRRPSLGPSLGDFRRFRTRLP
jgi:hypothetical protein